MEKRTNNQLQLKKHITKQYDTKNITANKLSKIKITTILCHGTQFTIENNHEKCQSSK